MRAALAALCREFTLIHDLTESGAGQAEPQLGAEWLDCYRVALEFQTLAASLCRLRCALASQGQATGRAIASDRSPYPQGGL